MKDGIIVRGKFTFKARTDLIPLIVRHITTSACYEEKTETTSRGFKDRQDWKPNGKLRCFKCRGNHRARDCRSSGSTSRYSSYVSPVSARPNTSNGNANNRATNRELGTVSEQISRDMGYEKTPGRHVKMDPR